MIPYSSWDYDNNEREQVNRDEMSCSDDSNSHYYHRYGERSKKRCQLVNKINLIRDSRDLLQDRYRNNIINLEFFNSNLTEIMNGVFDQIENNLEILSLKGVHLQTISINALSSLKALRTLYLDENQLESIVPGVFNGLEYLENLKISQNSLTGSLKKLNF